MKIERFIKTEIELTKIRVKFDVGYLKNYSIDGEEVNEITEFGDLLTDDGCLCLNIDPNNGMVLNYNLNKELIIYSKVRDEGHYTYFRENDTIIRDDVYEYVPDFLAIDDNGYGDYICLTITTDGFIKNWNEYRVKKHLEEKED